MKYAIAAAALSLFSLQSMAADGLHENRNEPVIQQYSYSQDLDISKVISIDAEQTSETGAVPARMVYLDSQGVKRELRYSQIEESRQTHG